MQPDLRVTRRVAVLSPSLKFTTDLFARLRERGIRVDALILYVRQPARAGQKRGSAVGRSARWMRLWLAARFNRALRVGAARVVVTGPLNSRRMARDLTMLAPDVLVLARCGLLHPDILAIPREGVLNVHPGLLPWIRGNSPVGHSLMRDVPLGSSTFHVDRGIDTGSIVERRLVRVTPGDTLDTLRNALNDLWLEMTADLVARASREKIPPGAAQVKRFPLCGELSQPEQLAEMRQAVEEGKAHALFDRWKSVCDSRLTLPADFDLEPSLPHAGP
jgi:methionyl-tRNA formyltransferase